MTHGPPRAERSSPRAWPGVAGAFGLALFGLVACALQGRPVAELTLSPATSAGAGRSDVTPVEASAHSVPRRREPAPATALIEPAATDRACEEAGAGCASSYDCCAGQKCVGHACIASPAGATCFSDTACGRGMLCVQRRCTRCDGPGNAGAPCVGQFDCCGTSLCINKVCRSCKVSGSACLTYSDCCEGLACMNGTCKACSSIGEKCKYTSACCGLDSRCLEGTCRKCRGSQDPCESSFDCCAGLMCKANACAPL